MSKLNEMQQAHVTLRGGMEIRQWCATPHLRRLGFMGHEKLQQLWAETFTGKTEWRDVPLHIEPEQ